MIVYLYIISRILINVKNICRICNSCDEIYDLRANISAGKVRSKVFKGFTKACHSLYKFDSGTERDFAIVLENDKSVLKLMRPSIKQFDIYYDPGGINRYEPNFVIETSDKIYMIETKASIEVIKRNFSCHFTLPFFANLSEFPTS